jgi:transposase
METTYPESTERRAMQVKEVLLKAMAKQIKWIHAADILGVSPRTIRRLHANYEEHGVSGLIDKRRGEPSPKRVPMKDVETVLQAYYQRYKGYNAKHFYDKMRDEEGLSYSYTWVKNLLQDAGLVPRAKGRGKHRMRRERRPLAGQMIHLDGSDHEWLTLRPGERQTLLLVVDDATGWNLAARLVDAETTVHCLSVLREVVGTYGIPVQIYTDRDSVYWFTKKAGGPVDKGCLTQFGRAMKQLGVGMIAGYSPQARGRSERWNGTWQGRLPAELRSEGIDTMEDANRYIREVFLPDMNRRFTVEPQEEGSAFTSKEGYDLDRIFSIHHDERKVANDNTVRVNGLTLQIQKSPYRLTYAQCSVDVHEHLSGGYTILWEKRVIGHYDGDGKPLDDLLSKKGGFFALGKNAGWNRHAGKMKGVKAKTSTLHSSPAWALGLLPSRALSSQRAKR